MACFVCPTRSWWISCWFEHSALADVRLLPGCKWYVVLIYCFYTVQPFQHHHLFCFEYLWFWGSGAGGSWWALKELTGDRCELVCESEKGHAGLKFLLANTKPRMQLGANLSAAYCIWCSEIRFWCCMTRGLHLLRFNYWGKKIRKMVKDRSKKESEQ